MKLVLIILLASVAWASAADRPNILFLLTDDQRPDTISALGNDRIETPNLDRLVETGMTFTRATCSYPICVVSRAEILTGMHGWENGVDGIRNQFEEDVTFWAETLQQAGYETHYVGKWHTSGRPADRGYEAVNGLFGSGGGRWWEEGQTDWKGFPITGYRGWVFQAADGREKFPEEGVGLTPDIDSKFADSAIEVLDSDPEAPWFLHVNFTAPHDPLFMPPGLEGKYLAEAMEVPENFLPQHPFDHGNLEGRDETLMHFPRTRPAVKDVLRVYYSVIDYLDQQVGRILASLEESGQLENTIIIYASDHGMGVGSHGLRGKQSMYEHTINVPLIIAGPGIESSTSTDAQVYLRELYPTTCALAGVDIPETVTAESFAKVLLGEADQHHETIFGYFKDTQAMIREGDWKYIHYPQVGEEQLFHLTVDPLEKEDLSQVVQWQSIKLKLKQKLEAWQKSFPDE